LQSSKDRLRRAKRAPPDQARPLLRRGPCLRQMSLAVALLRHQKLALSWMCRRERSRKVRRAAPGLRPALLPALAPSTPPASAPLADSPRRPHPPLLTPHPTPTPGVWRHPGGRPGAGQDGHHDRAHPDAPAGRGVPAVQRLQQRGGRGGGRAAAARARRWQRQAQRGGRQRGGVRGARPGWLPDPAAPYQAPCSRPPGAFCPRS
jgi:hypothetical protein